MNNDNEKQISLDVLRHVEILSDKINNIMAVGTKSVFTRYPLTFTLLILVGAVAVSEGLKGILENFAFLANHPWRLLFLGLIILIATGTLYKKLDK